MKTITVSRSKWNRGNFGPDQVYMYDSVSGFYDICGFLYEQTGTPRAALENVERPSYTDLVEFSCVETIIHINDSLLYEDESEREEDLMKLFEEHEYELVFTP